ncbi:FAD-binding and (Fe-S)-binding domain-containing protein [Phnomibacter sp. MR]|uniref:FAD-binding and (Fe-S)-binding domain-containing protein n=1 Tax=Phnomibacter sp. MR TaxID=3042318 RepID=UPI003A7FBC2F
MPDTDQLLQQILPATHFSTRLIDRITYASDAGFYQLIPQAVLFPATVEDVQRIFELAQQQLVPVVFRAGGTSLSGQAITDGWLVDISKHWRSIQVHPTKQAVTVQPGVTGGMVNHYLKKHSQKIGPDPASIQAAMMGGIISNNASGMCCGVKDNSYHTIEHVHFVLPNGQRYHTVEPADYARFVQEQATLANTLTALREQILNNEALLQRIRHKYKTKNTVGYSLNALVDFEHPLDIFAHLLVGGEGTLAFIAEATMRTIADKPYKAVAMLYFPNLYEACSAIVPLKETGAEALELMDRASLKSVEHLPGLPDFFMQLPDGTAALLCEYQTEDAAALEHLLANANGVLQQLPLLHPAAFTTKEKERNFYWKLRKGMFPSVGAVRQRGTTVILEDITFPVTKLADGLVDLQQLFTKYGYHNAIIFGHAKDGNIHFVITQLLDTESEVKRYDAFMREVVSLVVNKYDGALKGEHGTGRNMAPFIEAEWGGEAYHIMQQIKQTADPKGLLNPGVIINASAQAHIEHLKDLPQVEQEVDKCIECGFCEVNCPSRDVTMTPRRRIVARRALQRLQQQDQQQLLKELQSSFQYDGLDTCATDGLCATDCPVDINTGELVKRLRQEQHGRMGNAIAGWMAKHFGFVATSARLGIAVLALFDTIKLVSGISRGLRKIIPGMPVWMHGLKAAKPLPTANPAQPDAVYFSSCINRVMAHGDEQKSLQQTMLDVCQQAGVQLLIPEGIGSQCCGQPFSSKGYVGASQHLLQEAVTALWQWTEEGRIPVVCDFSSCTYTFLQNGKHLPEPYLQQWQQIKMLDSVAFLQQTVLPKLKLTPKQEPVVLHPACAVTKLGLNDAFVQLAKACAPQAEVPAGAGCCGMAGDRGFLVPELVEGATAQELKSAAQIQSREGYSSSTTCELALSHHSDIRYKHIVYLLDEVKG